MATIIENSHGRRLIKISTDDIISIVKEYQNTISFPSTYEKTRKILDAKNIYLPEDM